MVAEQERMKTGRRLSRTRAAPERDGTGISPGDIADHNGRTALALLRAHGAMTRQELSAHLGLTEPAVTGIMKRLLADGLVLERKRIDAGRYTPAEFALRPDGAHALGLSLRPDGAELMLLGLGGQIVAARSLPTPPSQDALAEALEALTTESPTPPLGLGVALAPGCAVDLPVIAGMIGDMPLFSMPDTEAVVNAERLFGLGEPEGGLVVVLIDETVRAGLFIGGKVFRGMHGRAGQIGAMRPGRNHASLNEVAGLAAYRQAEAEGEAALEAWIGRAAGRLLDAVVAISGFVSPGAVLVGGALPDYLIDRLIDQAARDREKQEAYFVAASWIPPIRRTTRDGGGVTLGAAGAPFIERLLPKTM
ncbi:winged helix-turn-helix transcriptional regulator [Rhizobium rhizosphaerae]|nr:winged helix-turn-helix transcriptional regulator [Xaviernesmea rhizosphaerae]